MIQIQKANPSHVDGIVKVCTDANWATYSEFYSKHYIESIIDEFYNPERILQEVMHDSKDWGGYFVAINRGEVIGAAGGGIIDDTSGEIYVLYLNPNRRNEGVGSLLLRAITEQQKEWGIKEQWVSVQKGNQKAIPFYEAKGFEYQYEEKSGEYTSVRLKRNI